MWLLLALAAALLTSFLPIVNKRLLADTPVSVVAWAVNGLSLPLLGLAALALAPIPAIDSVFWLGLSASAVLNMTATLVSTQALKLGDASLVTPVLTFNPAFTLLIGYATLGEAPSLVGVLGVITILAGGYVLSLEGETFRWWRPFVGTSARPELALAILASFIWGLTPVAEKLAIQHSAPAAPVLVAFGTTALMTLLLTPLALRASTPLRFIVDHRRGFTFAAAIAGVAPIFGFTAIALGLVGYVTAIFKLSTVFSIAWAVLLLREHVGSTRLVGAALMVIGAVLIGV
jgi:uncharacterized membrane protein